MISKSKITQVTQLLLSPLYYLWIIDVLYLLFFYLNCYFKSNVFLLLLLILSFYGTRFLTNNLFETILDYFHCIFNSNYVNCVVAWCVDCIVDIGAIHHSRAKVILLWAISVSVELEFLKSSLLWEVHKLQHIDGKM